MTDPQALLTYLRNRLPRVTITGEPMPLPGGYLNHVWRVPTAKGSLIVKYAPPHLASNPAIALDPERIAFEASALALFDPTGMLSGLPTDWMRPPYVRDFDATRHVLIMEDVGRHHLLDRWLYGTHADAAAQGGEMLGHFIGALHARTFGDVHLADLFDNAGVQVVRHEVQYRAVGDLLRGLGVPDAGALGCKAEALGEAFQQPGQCVVMGDLWPRSILIVPDGLRLIDWEFVHFGRPAQDVGHLAAHIWMLYHCAPSPVKQDACTAFWQGFAPAYEYALGMHCYMFRGTSLAEQAAIHMGAEILMRTVGPFQAGYLYDGLGYHTPHIQAAVVQAAEAIRQSTAFDVLTALFPM